MRRCHVGIELPAVDVHAITIAMKRDQVWTGLRCFATRSLISGGNALTRILGTVPRSGFQVAEAVPGERLTLTGRHRFSRYALVFELHDGVGGRTVLRARTFAAFPGLHGRMYRALVIGTRLHVLATTHMLRAIEGCAGRVELLSRAKRAARIDTSGDLD